MALKRRRHGISGKRILCVLCYNVRVWVFVVAAVATEQYTHFVCIIVDRYKKKKKKEEEKRNVFIQ